MKKLAATLLGMALVFGGATIALADPPVFVTICHAAGLATEPANWVTLTLPENAVYGVAGHFNENGTPNAGHEQDYLGACTTPTPTPTPTVTPPPDEKVTICHATGSETNPYVEITVSVNGLEGHGDHTGDIIPAPTSGCPKPTPTPTTPPPTTPPPTHTPPPHPTPPPTVVPEPEPTCHDTGTCFTPDKQPRCERPGNEDVKACQLPTKEPPVELAYTGNRYDGLFALMLLFGILGFGLLWAGRSRERV